jgi:hypothetical protein
MARNDITDGSTLIVVNHHLVAQGSVAGGNESPVWGDEEPDAGKRRVTAGVLLLIVQNIECGCVTCRRESRCASASCGRYAPHRNFCPKFAG